MKKWFPYKILDFSLPSIRMAMPVLYLGSVYFDDGDSDRENLAKWKYIEELPSKNKEETAYYNRFKDSITSRIKFVDETSYTYSTPTDYPFALLFDIETRFSFCECDDVFNISEYLTMNLDPDDAVFELDEDESLCHWYFYITDELISLLSKKSLQFLTTFINELKQKLSTCGISNRDRKYFKSKHIFIPSNEDNRLFRQCKSYAANQHTVFINGETGTGKDIIANLIHHFRGKPNAPFVSVNCASIPPTLADAHLFGIIGGSATDVTTSKGKIVEADGGVLFLDEIGELSHDIQTKLLRFSEDRLVTPIGYDSTNRSHDCYRREVVIKIIVATNKNVEECVKSNQIREDFYYRFFDKLRINTIPLRDWRKEEFISLVYNLTRKEYHKEKKIFEKLSTELTNRLLKHDWPGNIRELENFIIKTCTETGYEGTLNDFLVPFSTLNNRNKSGDIEQIIESLFTVTMKSSETLNTQLSKITEECYKKIVHHFRDSYHNWRCLTADKIGCNKADHKLSQIINMDRTEKSNIATRNAYSHREDIQE